jgi:hemerythrin superfamily protein
MERKKFNEVSRMIKGIEKKNLELEEFLSNLSILSRENMLRDITQDIIRNSEILKQLGVNQDLIMPQDEQEEPFLFQAIVENSISEIKKNPSKKVLLLKELLNKMPDISDNDKNVILQSIKDEDPDKLKEKILSLVKIFKLQL